MADDAPVMIHCERLRKAYGDFEALRGVSFDVRAGEILGFLGPNGAGKTTTMKILTCFLAPTSGLARVAGHDVQTDSLEVRRRVGYLPEDTPLYKDMLVLEYLEYVAELRGLPRRKRRARIKELGEVTGILEKIGSPIGALSKGFRQRVGLTQAILHDPDILILDEPTSGLDPNQIVDIRELIRDLGKEKTVILSTHILQEVQATCDRVLIISGGTLVADGRPEELVAQRAARFRLALASSDAPPAADVVARLQGLEGVSTVTETPGEALALQLELTSTGNRDLRRDLYDLCVAEKWPLLELERQEASLEEVFRHLTREAAGGGAAQAKSERDAA